MTPHMPQLWAEGRRLLLLLLVGLGLGLGAVSVLLAAQTGALISSYSFMRVLCVVGLAGLFGLGKFVERIWAEKLGQHYVAQLRRGLIEHSLNASRAPALGITVARSSNDLASVRNWVIQGLVPLTAGIPLLVFSLAGLWFVAPILVLALAVPLMLELVILRVLAPGAFQAARILRQHRGTLAARVADTAAAATSIRSAGGVQREVNRVDQSADKVIAASVYRARYAGALRACALSIPLLGSILVVALASQTGLSADEVASGLLLLGLSAAVLAEFGRMVEYRQNYKAARRILAPLLAQSQPPGSTETQRLPLGAVGSAAKLVRVELGDAQLSGWPILVAAPGDKIRIQGPAVQTEQILQGVATGHLDDLSGTGGVWVGGKNLGRIPDHPRRRLLGAALSSMVLERGTLLRALRYRRPNSKPEVVLELAADCGLSFNGLPERERTMLRRGGEPLNRQQRAALLITRAMLEQPQFLVIDEVVAQLDPSGWCTVRQLLNEYPGVLLYRGELPGVKPSRIWEPRTEVVTAPMPVVPLRAS